ncbi:hypothetical protein NM96_13655 [Neisseria mucosa]|uniref:Uncharacterized protein n=2 Tax=Neisseriales TaxID=206351 RepID=A0ABN4Y876_NEIMU|nr:hypothetical protein A6J88_05420 [Neisseria mucosa]AVR80208.1 hypothetical protein NM96_13655 [Neisseria mucosa]
MSQIPHKPYPPNRTSSENTMKLFLENHHDKSASTFSDDLSPDKGTGSADYTHSAKLYPQPAGNFIHKAPRESANRITPRAISIYSTEIDKR